MVPIRLLAHIMSVQRLTSPDHLEPYLDRQILSRDTVLQRFHYKRPELFAIEISCHLTDSPFAIQETPEIAGCHSWVPIEDSRRL